MHRAESVHSRQGLQRRALHPTAQRQVQQGDALEGVEVRHADVVDVCASKPQVVNATLIILVVDVAFPESPARSPVTAAMNR